MPRLEPPRRRPPGVHVLDGERDAGGLLEGGDALDEAGGVLALPAERRVHDDHVGADLGGHLGRPLELAPRVGAPDPLGEQQARRVDRADRHLVVLGELLDRRDLLAEGVDADHHLDGVVAEAARVRRRRARSTRGRPRRSTDRSRERTRSPPGRRAGRSARGSRPRAAPTGRSPARAGRRCPCTPRRPARPARSGGRGSARHRAASASSSSLIAISLGIQLEQLVQRSGRAAPAARRRRARRRRSGPASGTSSTSPPPGPGRPRGAGGRRRGRSRRGSCLRSARTSSSPGRPSAKNSRASRAAPSGSDHATSGASSAAAGDLQRAAADVEDRQPPGRPAEPAAYGEEGQPRLVLTGQHLDVDPGARRRTSASTSSELTASRTAEVANAEHLLAALVLGDHQRGRDEVGRARRCRAG